MYALVYQMYALVYQMYALVHQMYALVIPYIHVDKYYAYRPYMV